MIRINTPKYLSGLAEMMVDASRALVTFALDASGGLPRAFVSVELKCPSCGKEGLAKIFVGVRATPEVSGGFTVRTSPELTFTIICTDCDKTVCSLR